MNTISVFESVSRAEKSCKNDLLPHPKQRNAILNGYMGYA